MKLELDGLTKEFGDFTAVNYIKCVKKLFLSRNIGKGNKRKII